MWLCAYSSKLRLSKGQTSFLAEVAQECVVLDFAMIAETGSVCVLDLGCSHANHTTKKKSPEKDSMLSSRTQSVFPPPPSRPFPKTQPPPLLSGGAIVVEEPNHSAIAQPFIGKHRSRRGACHTTSE